MRKWITTVTVTKDGDTGTATTPVCAPTETEAATSIVTKLHSEGYTTSSRVDVQPDSHCTGQH
jgi:hypothetical protein